MSRSPDLTLPSWPILNGVALGRNEMRRKERQGRREEASFHVSSLSRAHRLPEMTPQDEA